MGNLCFMKNGAETVSENSSYFFSSSCSLKIREKFINFAQLILLSLYIFWRKCVYFSIFEWYNWKVNTLYKLRKTTWAKRIYFFFLFWGNERRKKLNMSYLKKVFFFGVFLKQFPNRVLYFGSQWLCKFKSFIEY